MALLTADLPFLRRFFAHPLQVASPVPSGPALAQAIARQIEPDGQGLVLELGPGTGKVTQAILNRGVAAPDLVTLENDPAFVAVLRKRFPMVNIVEGDAFDFPRALDAQGVAGPFRAIVSGIPVLSQLVSVRQRFLTDAMAMLKTGAPFVQFSYGVHPPLPPLAGVEVRRAEIVWRSLPRMHISSNDDSTKKTRGHG